MFSSASHKFSSTWRGPICLEVYSGRSYFKFENMWPRKECFPEEVEDLWSDYNLNSWVIFVRNHLIQLRLIQTSFKFLGQHNNEWVIFPCVLMQCAGKKPEIWKENKTTYIAIKVNHCFMCKDSGSSKFKLEPILFITQHGFKEHRNVNRL